MVCKQEKNLKGNEGQKVGLSKRIASFFKKLRSKEKTSEIVDGNENSAVMVEHETDKAKKSDSKRAVTDDEIIDMALKHEPLDINTAEAKRMMDSALNKIIPNYTGIQNLTTMAMLCDPQSIMENISETDTDTLIVVFKALGVYMGQGQKSYALGVIQNNVLETLKTRF